MTKNVTTAGSDLPSSQRASASQINKGPEFWMLANFFVSVISKESDIQKAKEEARIHREERAPKNMSKSEIMRRGNDRAHGVQPKKAPPKINRHLLQTENATELSVECEEIVDGLNLTPKDKDLLLNLIKSMRHNFSDDDLRTIYSSLETLKLEGTPLFLAGGISVPDIINHTTSYNLKPAAHSAENTQRAVDIIAKNTRISPVDAQRLLEEIYNALKPNAENLITKCVTSKFEKEKFSDITKSNRIIAGVLGSMAAVCVILALVRCAYKRSRNRQAVPVGAQAPQVNEQGEQEQRGFQADEQVPLAGEQILSVDRQDEHDEQGEVRVHITPSSSPSISPSPSPSRASRTKLGEEGVVEIEMGSGRS